MPVPAEHDHAWADFVGLHSVTVEFQLVHPVVAGGHCFGGYWTAGRDEAELGHGLKDVAAACRSGNWQIRDLIVSGFWGAQIAEPLGAMAERFLVGHPVHSGMQMPCRDRDHRL